MKQKDDGTGSFAENLAKFTKYNKSFRDADPLVSRPARYSQTLTRKCSKKKSGHTNNKKSTGQPKSRKGDSNRSMNQNNKSPSRVSRGTDNIELEVTPGKECKSVQTELEFDDKTIKTDYVSRNMDGSFEDPLDGGSVDPHPRMRVSNKSAANKGPGQHSSQAVNQNYEEMMSYLLDERNQFIQKVDHQNKLIDNFREEIRKIKTLSQYYPEDRTFVIEEENSERPINMDGQDGFYNYEQQPGGNQDQFDPLRASHDSVGSDKSGLLRKSSYFKVQSPDPEGGIDPLRSSSNGVVGLGGGGDPLRSSSNGLRDSSNGLGLSNGPNFDPLRGSSNGLRTSSNGLRESSNGLRGSNNGLRDSVNGLRASSTGFSSPNPLHQRQNSSSQMSIPRSKNDLINTQTINDISLRDPTATEGASHEVETLLNNFTKFVDDKFRNEELSKFAEFIFAKIQTLVQQQDAKIEGLKNKNFNLISVVAELKLKERERKIQMITEPNHFKTHLHHDFIPKQSHDFTREFPQDMSYEWEHQNPQTQRSFGGFNRTQPQPQKGLRIPDNLKMFTEEFNSLNSLGGFKAAQQQQQGQFVGNGGGVGVGGGLQQGGMQPMGHGMVGMNQGQNGPWMGHSVAPENNQPPSLFDIGYLNLPLNYSNGDQGGRNIPIQTNTTLNTGPQTQYFSVSINPQVQAPAPAPAQTAPPAQVNEPPMASLAVPESVPPEPVLSCSPQPASKEVVVYPSEVVEVGEPIEKKIEPSTEKLVKQSQESERQDELQEADPAEQPKQEEKVEEVEETVEAVEDNPEKKTFKFFFMEVRIWLE